MGNALKTASGIDPEAVFFCKIKASGNCWKKSPHPVRRKRKILFPFPFFCDRMGNEKIGRGEGIPGRKGLVYIA